MSHSGHNFGLYILLDIFPLLPRLGRTLWKKFSEVARLDIRDDTAILHGVVVIDDY